MDDITSVVLCERDSITYTATTDAYWYRVKNGVALPAFYECKVETIGKGNGGTISIAFVSISMDKVLYIGTITDSVAGTRYSVTYTPNEDCYIMFNKVPYATGTGLPTAVRTDQNLTVGTVVNLLDYSTNVLKFDLTVTVTVDGESIVRNSAIDLDKKEIIVDMNGGGDYTSIQTAVANYKEGQEIVVYPGTYIIPNGETIATTKHLVIRGIDRETCVIRSYDGRYGYPPFTVSHGCFSNLTIEALYLSGTTEPGDETWNGRILAFALHSENAIASDKTLMLTNCTLRSDFGHALGVGLYKGMKLFCENCIFINGETADHHGVFYQKFGAVGFHNMSSASTAGHCDTFFKDCVMKSGTTYCIAIWDASNQDSARTMDCTFINNTLYTDEEGFNCELYKNNTLVFTEGSTITLNAISHGNTMTVLNA
jgi:hypothetical protein